MNPILKYLEEHREDMLEDLKQFVEKETPSTNKPLLDAFAEFLAGYAGTVAGGRVEVLPAEVSGNNVRVRWGREDGGPPLFCWGTTTPSGPREPWRRYRLASRMASPRGRGSST